MSPPRGLVGAVAVSGALGLAVGGALLTRDPASGVNLAIETLSSRSSGTMEDIAGFLPLGVAFAAGMVSTVNPCGFVLLPTYLGLFLGEGEAAVDAVPRRVGRGVVVGSTVALGFVVLFALIGLLVGAVAGTVVAVLPWLGLGVGVVLVVAGGYRLAGQGIHSSLPQRLSAHVSGAARPGLAGYFLYGLAYGVASLSCTLPIFLAVVGGSLASGDVRLILGGVGAYGLGMGLVVLVLTVVATLFKSAVIRRLRGATRLVDPLGTALLFLAGTYVVYYWLTIGGLLGRPEVVSVRL